MLDITTFELKGGGGQNKAKQDFLGISSQKRAFTLAEVLITLSVIGVVAALVIPFVTQKYYENVRAAQLQKAYYVLENAHRMMIADAILPYKEFVEPFLNNDSQENPGSSDQPSEEPDTPVIPPTEPDPPAEDTQDPETPSEQQKPSLDDMDKSTKDLVLDLIKYALLGQDDKRDECFNQLKDKYGYNNWSEFLKDLGLWSFSPENNFNKKHLFITSFALLNTVNSNENNSNENLFIEVKKQQLAILKKYTNGSEYCTDYRRCISETSPVVYTNLNGNIANIQAGVFENSALMLNDGMIIWLGNINNPAKYFVDINGIHKPNKLGVDVFSFVISDKNVIKPEMNANCTISGTAVDGEEFRGSGCSGYALMNINPDNNEQKYWKCFK